MTLSREPRLASAMPPEPFRSQTPRAMDGYMLLKSWSYSGVLESVEFAAVNTCRCSVHCCYAVGPLLHVRVQELLEGCQALAVCYRVLWYRSMRSEVLEICWHAYRGDSCRRQESDFIVTSSIAPWQQTMAGGLISVGGIMLLRLGRGEVPAGHVDHRALLASLHLRRAHEH